MTDKMQITPAALSALASGDIENAVIAATPGGIERQEAEGQAALVSSFRTLPISMDRVVGEAFGFVYGAPVDDIFIGVRAPDGWSLLPTDHSMWSKIIDDKGRQRGSIFYKAAFYDRNAHGYWDCRYRVEPEYVDHKMVSARAIDSATGEAIFRVPVIDGDEQTSWAREREAEKQAREQLLERFPKAYDNTAYWEDQR